MSSDFASLCLTPRSDSSVWVAGFVVDRTTQTYSGSLTPEGLLAMSILQCVIAIEQPMHLSEGRYLFPLQFVPLTKSARDVILIQLVELDADCGLEVRTPLEGRYSWELYRSIRLLAPVGPRVGRNQPLGKSDHLGDRKHRDFTCLEAMCCTSQPDLSEQTVQ